MKSLNFLKNKYLLSVFFILGVMFSIMVASSLNDSPTADEMTHTFSGYSYIKTHSLSFNTEHPPFIKDLVGMSLAVYPRPNFPSNAFYAIHNNFWGFQWTLGSQFFYFYNHNPSEILLFARLPVMILSLILGFFVYLFSRKYYGEKAGILSLVLYAFSTTVLANGRLVTTDLGISLFFFLSVVTFIELLKKYSYKNIVYFSLALTGAFLTKFSAVLLLPTLGVILFVKPFFEKKVSLKLLYSDYKKYIPKAFLGVLLATIFTIFYYEIHTLFMSHESVKEVIRSVIPGNKYSLQSYLIKISEYSKGVALYLVGFLYVFKHNADGHLTFLFGQVSQKGWWYFFPISFLYKTPISFLILLGVSIGVFLKRYLKSFTEWAILISILIYLGFSITSKMNIGIRHLLPLYPLIFVFMGKLMPWAEDFIKKSKKISKQFLMERKKILFLMFLMGLYVLEALIVFPHYIAYVNQFIPNKKDAYKYFADSNLDWGQDLKRLGQYVKENNTNNITVDYFGGGASVNYYIPGATVWDKKTIPKGYFAVSVTNYQFYHDQYKFLEGKEPVDEVGYSILIFKL